LNKNYPIPFWIAFYKISKIPTLKHKVQIFFFGGLGEIVGQAVLELTILLPQPS
jgi:hypothetical protein